MDKVDICVRLRATGLQLSHEAATEIERLRNVIYRMYRDEVEYVGCNNVRDWERDYPWIMDIVGTEGDENGSVG